MRLNVVSLVVLIVLCTESTWLSAQWEAGFARVDVTPKEPVRMGGYGSRDHASEGIDTPLYVRAVALRSMGGDPRVLVSVDTIGLDARFCKDVAEKTKVKQRLDRDRLVLCSTHTHCAPDLDSNLDNIFAVPMTLEEKAAAARYRIQLLSGVELAIEQALSTMRPSSLAFAQGKAGFAANRRVIKDGRWTGFGVQSDGPVDHSVPVLRISDPDGKVRGVLFNYACHCTTLGGSYYRINAEWAGYVATNIESTFDGAIALCTIGCGADANPAPRDSLDLAQLHGRELSQSVLGIVRGNMKLIDAPIESTFDYAGLSFELPTIEELRTKSEDSNPQTRRHAQKLIEVYQREGRLPATYPVPIQAWKFGDQLKMVFLGGEVVVDYGLRLKRELDNDTLWVTAYANDVLGYIASQRMRSEGGYEFDRSGVFYGLPGPWAAGSEDLLINRVKDLLRQPNRIGPKSTSDAMESFKVATGYEIQLVAAEPLVVDPVNIAFGADGKLWVVEMGDYPLGPGNDSSKTGRVKFLEDLDLDGTFDRATVFLDGLSFPTGAQPWRDGVIVSAAPDVFFARDIDGDGKADQRTVLFSGFPLANPQHRINGFTYGLDHSFHLASGDNLGNVRSEKTGQTLNAAGRDLQIWPDSGDFEITSGRTQFVRSRDDWGNWFGNDNSRPMFHYPIDEVYLRRNRSVRYSGNLKNLFTPASAPPVFPQSRTIERFNDLYAENRFTSACSAIVFRSSALGETASDSVFVCEPVHNLVHRSQLLREGSTFRTQRVPSERESEFLASTDPWFRPVRVATGTDGMLWVVDMYRQVIEHPEWIPIAWQQQLDLRAGETLGRIYRVVQKGHKREPLPNIASVPQQQLIEMFNASNGSLRDLAQRLVIERADTETSTNVSEFLQKRTLLPQARVHAIWTLAVLGNLSQDQLRAALRDEHIGVIGEAVRVAEKYFPDDEAILTELSRLSEHADPSVRLRVALALGNSMSPVAGEVLAKLARQDLTDAWLRRALVTSASKHADSMLDSVLTSLPKRDISTTVATMDFVNQLIVTAGPDRAETRNIVADALDRTNSRAAWIMPLIAELAGIDGLIGSENSKLKSQIKMVYSNALVETSARTGLSATSLIQSIQLFGRGLGDNAVESELLVGLLIPTEPLEVQLAVIDRLAAFRDARSVETILAKWRSLSQSVRERFEQQCLSIPKWSEQLLADMEQDKFKPRDVSPAFRQQLRASGNRSFKSRVDRVLGTIDAGARKKLVDEYLNAAVSPGDSDRGAPLFTKHCATCHIGNAQTLAVGPQLTNLTNRSVRAMTESILDPNLAVDPQYRTYVILLKSGLTSTGVISEEVGDSLTVAHHNGRRTTILRNDIELMSDTGISLMPEGIQQELSPQGLRDLIAFLQLMPSGINSRP